MNSITTEISALIELAERRLLTPPVDEIEYLDKVDLPKNELSPSIIGIPFNLYALWIRRDGGNAWECMYIGQRKRKKVASRLRQHLFKTPTKTQSKFQELTDERNAGCAIGVTGVNVEPDSIRLAFEEELIYRNTRTPEALPWNTKGRQVPLKKNV